MNYKLYKLIITKKGILTRYILC